MAEQPATESPTMAQQKELSEKAKEFVHLWMEESNKLYSDDLANYTLESITKFMRSGRRTFLQKVPDLEKVIKENNNKKDELKGKQETLHNALNRIAMEVKYIEEDAGTCHAKAISACEDIDRKIQAQKKLHEEKLNEEKRKLAEEVKKKTETLHHAMKRDQLKIIDQHQALLAQEENEWQKLVALSESKKKWRSLNEFKRIDEDPITEASSNIKLELIITETEEILEEREIMVHEELTVKAEPINAPVKQISVKNKSDGRLVATIAVNQSELASLTLSKFRAIAVELPTEFTILFKSAPIRSAQETKFLLKMVLDGDCVWIN